MMTMLFVHHGIDVASITIKEKYGRLGVAYLMTSGTDEYYAGFVEGIVKRTIYQCSAICESCGNPGQLSIVNNWVFVSCPVCFDIRGLHANSLRATNVPFFVDLDGVLADFEYQLLRVAGVRVHDVEDDAMWAHVNAYDSSGEWFLDLPLMPGARELWSHIRQFSPTILTATGRAGERAAEQKKAWVLKHFGITPDRVIAVRKSEEKAAYMTVPGSILIDDNLQRCVLPWTAAGGRGIHHVNYRMTLAQVAKHLDSDRAVNSDQRTWIKS